MRIRSFKEVLLDFICIFKTKIPLLRRKEEI